MVNATFNKFGKKLPPVKTGQRFGEEIKKDYNVTKIFIKPGFKFKVVDALFTNFHLPKSTLLMLISAFAGSKFTKKAYNHAIEKKYRFFSYGDAMFIEQKDQN